MNAPEELLTSRIFYLKNLTHQCCFRLVREDLEKLGLKVNYVKMGEVGFDFNPSIISEETIIGQLEKNGFELIQNRESILINQIKNAVIDLVHHSTFNAMVKNSDFLVQKFSLSYQYMSTLFSNKEHITLEKYIILQKIEKVKELIRQDELSLSEIAFIMGYSSVQYLSTQFKKITGISVSDYKQELSPVKMEDNVQTD